MQLQLQLHAIFSYIIGKNLRKIIKILLNDEETETYSKEAAIQRF